MTKLKPYIPNKLPLKNLDLTKLIPLISKANIELGRYDGCLKAVPNPDILLSPMTTQEAVLSSKIEGTQASLTDVLEYDAGLENKANAMDIKEVLNYRNAVFSAVNSLKKRPLSLNLILNIHHMLLENVRGSKVLIGNFRKTQNWIGVAGCKQEDAKYIPPKPEDLMQYIYNFVEYLNKPEMEEQDIIVQTAIMHAQFELLHPFIDGNGRVGRLLIPLFLYAKKLISIPMFYISGYFERNRQEYYECLNVISMENNWSKWVNFFLNSVIEQSKINTKKVEDILILYKEMKEKIPNIINTKYTVNILDTVFTVPVFSSRKFLSISKIPAPTVKVILRKLVQAKILKLTEKAISRKPA
ncbi:MAG: Fic family protein, partial [Endomicrobium sp.]|nr:Fic family protein [Endomicrobium sp.]